MAQRAEERHGSHRTIQGTLRPCEISTPAVRSLDVAASGAASTDAFGTQRVPGTGHLPDGTAIQTAHVRPALVD